MIILPTVGRRDKEIRLKMNWLPHSRHWRFVSRDTGLQATSKTCKHYLVCISRTSKADSQPVDTLNATGISTPTLGQELASRATEFTTVDEAREVLEFNSAQPIHMYKKYLRLSETSSEPPSKGNFVRVYAGVGMWTPNDFRNTVEYLADHEAIAAMNREWFIASGKLWTKLQRAGGRDFYRMSGLRIVALATYITHLAARMPQCGLDRYLHSFQEIVALVKGIMKFWEEEGRDPRKGQIDTGVATSLIVVGLRCRHSATRREAIAMLRSANRREGVWDSSLLAKGADLIRSVEEGDEMVDFMPEERRAAMTGAWVDLQNRRLRVTWHACKYFPEKVEEESIISW
jgi:hypothetical protein